MSFPILIRGKNVVVTLLKNHVFFTEEILFERGASNKLYTVEPVPQFSRDGKRLRACFKVQALENIILSVVGLHSSYDGCACIYYARPNRLIGYCPEWDTVLKKTQKDRGVVHIGEKSVVLFDRLREGLLAKGVPCITSVAGLSRVPVWCDEVLVANVPRGIKDRAAKDGWIVPKREIDELTAPLHEVRRAIGRERVEERTRLRSLEVSDDEDELATVNARECGRARDLARNYTTSELLRLGTLDD